MWFEDTNMIHKGLYTTLRELWLFWSQCRRTLFSQCTYIPFCSCTSGLGVGGGRFLTVLLFHLSRRASHCLTILLLYGVVQLELLASVVSNLRGQSGRVSLFLFTWRSVFSLIFSLHYRKSDFYRWRNSTLIDSPGNKPAASIQLYLRMNAFQCYWICL